MKTELDEFDIKILEIVQENNRVSTEAIAEEACLSPSAVQRRLRRMRKEGVIEAERAVISPEAVGGNLITIVEVTLENEEPDTIKHFTKVMNDAPQVMQCYYVIGAVDFIIIMVSKTMQEYYDFANQFFLNASYIKRYQTSVVVQKVKYGLKIPLSLK